MGLLDQVIGSVVGGGKPAAMSSTSPLTKALLILLAAKAAHSYFSGSKEAPAGSSAGTPAAPPSGKIESGILAGMPSLDSMLDHFRSKGHDDKVESWIGSGPNKPLQPQELESTLGPQALDHLQKESGLSRGDLLSQLSTALPQVVDKLTPNGRLPTSDERSRW